MPNKRRLTKRREVFIITLIQNLEKMRMIMEEWKGALNKNLKSEKMILEAYSFFKQNGITERTYNLLKERIIKSQMIHYSTMIDFVLEVGMYAEKIREMDDARQIY